MPRKYREAIAWAISSMGDERDQRLARQSVTGEKGSNHRRCRFSPDRETQEYGRVVRHVGHPGLKRWLETTITFTPRLGDGLFVVLGVRRGRLDFKKIGTPSTVNLTGNHAGVTGAGEVRHQRFAAGLA